MKKTLSLVVCALFMVVLMSGFAFSASEQAAEQESTVTISGKITDDNQLIDEEGQTFEIVETEKGMELLNYVDQEVQIKGTLMESEGKKLITILDYEVLDE